MTSAPTSTTGFLNGDQVLNTQTGDVYQLQSGAWVKTGSVLTGYLSAILNVGAGASPQQVTWTYGLTYAATPKVEAVVERPSGAFSGVLNAQLVGDPGLTSCVIEVTFVPNTVTVGVLGAAVSLFGNVPSGTKLHVTARP